MRRLKVEGGEKMRRMRRIGGMGTHQDVGSCDLLLYCSFYLIVGLQ